MPRTIRFEGEILPDQEKTYIHLPVDMPLNATRLEVAYEYSQRIGSDPLLTGGNTIDLGIFDQRGIKFLHAGFRGWSGSERDSFFIAENDATPGYLAGPLRQGVWHLLLGLYKIAPDGCRYRVTITVTTEREHTDEPMHMPTAELPQPPRELPASKLPPRTSQWLRGELHCHSFHSDGDSGPLDLVQLARERGLDFLALTDHNSISHQRELEKLTEPGLILLRGVEVTTFRGHFNVWGIRDWVDFRVRQPREMEAAIRYAVECGAVTACNHPKPFGPDWDYKDVSGYQCVEVWNGPWHVMNQMSLEFWLEQLAQGKRIVAIGGSDYHRRSQLEEMPPRAPGTPTTWVYIPATPSEASILDAIRAGHVSLSDEPTGPFLELRADEALEGDVLPRRADGMLTIRIRCERGSGNRLLLLDQRGVVLERRISKADASVTASVSVASSLYLRAELRAPDDTIKALTNPIYVDQG